MHHFIVVFALALCFKQLGEQQLVEQAKPCCARDLNARDVSGSHQSSKQQTFLLCHQQPLPCCAGLLGANFAQILLNAGKFDDPIARGLSTSGAAHGLGTAAMAAT